MRPCSAKSPRRRQLVGPALVFTLALSAGLPAQDTSYATRRFGQSSGFPIDVAKNLELHLDQCTLGGGQGMVVVRGGIPGNLAGLVVGLQRWNIPVFGATSLVSPLTILWRPFDAQGSASFPLWKPSGVVGFKFQTQALHIGKRKTETVFALSEGMEGEVVKTPKTDWTFDTAKLMAQMSWAVWHDLSNRSLWNDESATKKNGTDSLRAVFDEHRTKNTPPAGLDWQVVDHIDQKATTTELFIAKNDTGDIVIACQPTNGVADWVKTNLNAAIQNGYHKGFHLAYQSIKDELVAKLKLLWAKIPDKSTKRVYITGLSLGGALSTIITYELLPVICAEGYLPANVVLYTFGAPRSLAATRYAQFKSRVPHHWAFAAPDDLVTHVPPTIAGFTHVPNVVDTLPTYLRQTREGNKYANDHKIIQYRATVFNVLAHGDYRRRILVRLHDPKLQLSVSSGGYMAMSWTFKLLGNPNTANDDIPLAGDRDYVALYRGVPNGENYLPANTLTASWQWTKTHSSWVTGWPKGDNFYCAYIQREYALADFKMLAHVGPYVPDFSGLKLSITKPGKFVTLHWTYNQMGRWDRVALFHGKPTSVNDRACGINTWQYAHGKDSYTTSWQAARDLYVGYIQSETLTDPGHLVKVEGPFSFLGKPGVGLTFASLWPYFLQINWQNARTGFSDWVAIYDRDPRNAGAKRLHWNYATGSSWFQTAIPWKAGYYAAHFEQDCATSPSKLVAVWGPLK